jgi:hypothetical protein
MPRGAGTALEQRLGQLGRIEGCTIAIERRLADARNSRFAEIAAEFVRAQGRRHFHGGKRGSPSKAGYFDDPDRLRRGDTSAWRGPGWQALPGRAAMSPGYAAAERLGRQAAGNAAGRRGSGRDLCELGLDALPFGRELIDLRVVGVEIRALRNVRDQAIDLAVELCRCGAADASRGRHFA